MVPPRIGYSIWKFWVIRVLVSLVFHVFSTTELILHCKNSEFCRLSFSIIFLHDFILFGIDMHQNRSISLFKTLFDHFQFYPLVALKCYPHLIMCLMVIWGYSRITRDLKQLSYTGSHHYIKHPILVLGVSFFLCCDFCHFFIFQSFVSTLSTDFRGFKKHRSYFWTCFVFFCIFFSFLVVGKSTMA